MGRSAHQSSHTPDAEPLKWEELCAPVFMPPESPLLIATYYSQFRGLSKAVLEPISKGNDLRLRLTIEVPDSIRRS